MNRILITGGVGFIGYFLSENLSKDRDNDIHIVDNLSKSQIDESFSLLIENDNVTFTKLDLVDLKCYSKLENEYDQIYHLAAIVGVRKVTKNPVLTLRVNTLSTIYLLDHVKDMKNHPKFLFGSTCENYSSSIKNCNIPIPTPEDIPLCIDDIQNPRWSYASSKILGEVASFHYSKIYDFNSTIVRFHNIYGPRMGNQHVIPEFILRLKENPQKFEMYGGYQYRSFCYVTDAVKMTSNIMNSEKTNNLVINIGNDHSIQISELAKLLFDIMGISPKIIEKGAPQGSVNKRRPELKLIKDLGCYNSTITFTEGLNKTFEWYQNNFVDDQ